MNDELLAKEMLSSLNDELGGNESSAKKKRPSYAPLFDNIAGWLLIAVIFLLPFIILPFASVPLDLAKKATLVIGVSLAFLFWLGARLEDGILSVPKSPILLGGGLVALTALISSIASGMFNVTFWGIGTETNTVAALFVFVALLLLSAIYFQSRKRLATAVKVFMLSFMILAVLELLRLFPTFQGVVPMFGHGTTVFGLLPNVTDNLLGKWNNLGTFFALGVVVCMSLLELIESHAPRLLYIGGAVGLLLMFLVNFNVAWAVLGVIALVLLVYRLSMQKMFGAKPAPAVLISFIVFLLFSAFGMPWLIAHNYSPYLVTLIIVVLGFAVLYYSKKLGIISSPALYVLLISILCFFLYTQIGSYLGANQISSLEVRPAWGSTFEVVGKVLSKHALTGSGPNTFSNDWLTYKPAGVNDTVFWSTDFNAGVGYIPTFVATTGILGLIAWLFLLVSYLYFGIKALFKLSGDHLTHGVLSVSFLSSLFLWIMAVVYVPDTVVLALAFAATGIFVSSLVTTKFSGEFTLSFFNSPRFSFVGVLSIVVLMLVSVSFLFFSVKKYIALANFQSALIVSNTSGDLVATSKYLETAVSLDGSDVFYRSLTDLHVLEMSKLMNTSDVPKEELQKQFQAVLAKAIESGSNAVKADGANYQNHLSFGRVYESLVPILPAAYDRAVAEYKAALALNPHNPQIYLTMARLEVAKGDKTKAREMISKALAEKSNYAAAIFLLSQIEADAGNLDAAIKNAQQAAELAPQDIGALFQLGFLKYMKHDYAGAISVLGAAVQINPSYSNAKYFLGLSLAKTGKTNDAIQQFKEIAESNPDNADVKRILGNLEAGRDALTNAPAPAPEKRKSPPVAQ
ncbi:MAG: tetratricopeptide repeat protein [Candidatus Paceibacterota bacterium]|jgi:tetratricopeptide (TPR) repeat protein